MNHKDELAFAILLWRNVRTGKGTLNKRHILDYLTDVERASSTALEIAKAAGVHKEFLELLLAMPTMTITIKELDSCETSKKSVTSSNGPKRTSNGKPLSSAAIARLLGRHGRPKSSSSPPPKKSKKQSTDS